MLTGENGILKKAQEAKEKTEEASRKEIADLDKIDELISETTSMGETVEQVTDEKPGELENDGEVKVINSIEDLVVFASNVRDGNTYEGTTVRLGLSLDFNSSKSYVDPYRKDYGNYGYNGELKTLLTSGEGFIPIGNNEVTDEKNFKGIFEGNEKIIKNLYININPMDDINEPMVGLFGINYGEIKNLGVENCNIKVNSTSTTNTFFVGGIAGVNFNSIDSCYVSGNIMAVTETQPNLRVGGIIGQVSRESSVKNCYNTANISGKGLNTCRIGGIVGYINLENCEISNCYNRGLLEGEIKEKNEATMSLDLGGISGYSRSGTISKCYNCGIISNKTSFNYNIGGIVGTDTNSSDINDCHNTGKFLGLGVNKGQIIGNTSGTPNISHCTYLKSEDNYNGIGRSSTGDTHDLEANITKVENKETMTSILSVIGEKFKMSSDGYPILKWQK